jgi:hypothetical protein
MKSIVVFFLLNCVSYAAVSQYLVLDDSLRIYFPGNKDMRVVNSSNDLNYKVVVTNMSHKTIRSYKELVFDDTTSPFANYYWDLYQKIDADFKLVPKMYHSSDLGGIWNQLLIELGDQKKADSAIAVYDISKKDLLPLQSDTLQFNFLMGKQRLVRGEYGFQVFLRVGDTYAIHNNLRESIGRSYVRSEMYYIKVLKDLVLNLNNLPR